MGFFDKFKKKEEIEEQQEEKLPYDIKYSVTQDGRLQVDFRELQANFRQFYDTTRLIVGGNTSIVNGKQIESALISWYGSSDAVMLDGSGRECGRRVDYEQISLGVNIEQLQRDPNYCISVMKGLLNKERVDRYMEAGLQEKPAMECGNYVGEIGVKDGRYTKIFQQDIGQAVHNSNYMKSKRYERTMRLEETKQRNIEQKRAEIDRLNQEIENLSR